MVVDIHRETEHYLDLFKGYVLKSSRRSLLKVQQAGPILPPGEEKQAIHTLSYALKLPEAWRETKALLLAMAPKMEQAGRRDEWMPYLEQGIQLSQRLSDVEAAAELHLQLGILYHLRSKYEEAQAHLETSARKFERLNAFRNQARALNRLGQVALRQQQVDKATELVALALDLLPDENPERAYSYLVLGMIALNKRDWTEAIELFKQALHLWEQVDNHRMMGRVFTLLGSSLRRTEQYPEAIKAYQQAISLLKETEDAAHQAMAQMNLGNVYDLLEQHQTALDFYQEAKRTFRQTQDRLHLAMVHHNMGLAYRSLQRWEEAERALSSSATYHREIGNAPLLIDTISELGLTYLRQEDPIKAIDTFNQAMALLDQIEGQARYDYLHQQVTAYLEEAYKKLPAALE